MTPAIAARPPAIVLGGGVTALSIARSLSRARVPVDVLDVPYSPARYSRAVRRFVDVGLDGPQERMLDWLTSERNGAVLLAGSDEGVEAIARHRPELCELGYLPVEGRDEVLLMMLDKARTYALAREYGIAAPRVMPLRDPLEVEAAAAELDFPCVLKPVHSHLFVRKTKSRSKVEFIFSAEELRARVSELNQQGVQMLLTEVIVGPSDEFVSYFGYLDRDGQPLLSFTKRKLRQQPPGFGLGTLHETSHDPEVAAAGERFLQAAGFLGLGNVEFKRDANDGALKLIECNPRFAMSNELIRRSGVDLALFSYCRVLGLPTPPVDSYPAGVRLWDPVKDARAFLAYRRLGELSAPEWIASVARPLCFPTFRLDDPLPALGRLSWMVRNAERSGGRASTVISTTQGPSRGLSAGKPQAGGGLATPRAVRRLASRGRRGRAVAARVDVMLATGARPLWRRARAEGRLAALGERARDEIYQRIWTEAAVACGAAIEELAPGLFKLSRAGLQTRVYHQTVELDDPVTLRVALDKSVVHRLMVKAGVRTPERVEWTFDDPAPAIEFLQHAHGPCVVKPAAGTGGGHGVTPGIERIEELMRARIHAATGGERLLIERQAPGAVYRLLFLDGELLDVVRSVPAGVVGDGVSTIEQLIANENARRVAAAGAAGLSLLGMNLDTVLTLRRRGLKLASVPEAGVRLTLREATNNNAAEDNQTWRGEISDEVISAARAAADAVGLRLAGIDVVTPDIAAPLADTGGIITEVNGTPGLHHHYLVADQEAASRIAVPILDRLFDAAAIRAMQGVAESAGAGS